jgi:hypothetical protein
MERLLKVGKVKAKSALEVKNSRLGIGFEKLDRDVFDPEKAYDKVAKIGVKWIRLQSGWQRTEREKGVYHFEWLDKVVDNLLVRGLRPWMCLCYGNDLYTERAKTAYGAVGCPPIQTEEERQAWQNYVKAIAQHFKGRVMEYEVWNEPDGDGCWKFGPNATDLGNFTIATAKTLKEVDPEIKVFGVALMAPRLNFINQAFCTGMGAYIDAVTFHEYTTDERRVPDRVRSLAGLVQHYNPKLEVIMGESGSQSRSGGNGALWPCAWTPRRQAKQLLRHMVQDLTTEVKFTSYFSCMDMIEALNGVVGEVATYTDYGYFGVLGADFDEEGRSVGTYTEKPSFYALQTLAAVFSEDFEQCNIALLQEPEKSDRIAGRDVAIWDMTTAAFRRQNGSYAYVYWRPTELLTTEYEATVSFECSALPEKMRLIDMIDGTVYKIPDSMMEKDEYGTVHVHNLPIKDYPMVLTFGDFAEIIED